MTIAQLIAALNALPDHSATVNVAVGSFTQRYPSAYVTPFEVSKTDGGRIYVNLPEGYSIHKRKGVN